MLKGISLAEKYFKEGLELFRKNRLEEAISYFEKSRKLNPNNEINLFYLGLGYEREGDIEKARVTWEEAIKADNNFWIPHLFLGISYAEEWLEREGENVYLKKAIESYEKVAQLNSDDKDVKNFLGILKSYDEKI